MAKASRSDHSTNLELRKARCQTCPSILETPTSREHTVSAARTANGNLSFKIGPFSYILKPDGEIMRRYPYANNRARWEPAVEFLAQGDWQDAFAEGQQQAATVATPSPR